MLAMFRTQELYLTYIIDLKAIMGEDPEDPRGFP